MSWQAILEMFGLVSDSASLLFMSNEGEDEWEDDNDKDEDDFNPLEFANVRLVAVAEETIILTTDNESYERVRAVMMELQEKAGIVLDLESEEKFTRVKSGILVGNMDDVINGPHPRFNDNLIRMYCSELGVPFEDRPKFIRSLAQYLEQKGFSVKYRTTSG